MNPTNHFEWKEIKTFYKNSYKMGQILDESSQQPQFPQQRWGHSSVFMEDKFILFAGFAESEYMNDVWEYDIQQRDWKQLQTTGKIPGKRSNHTANYSPYLDKMVIYGGGGKYKKRYNDIFIFDVNTKVWEELETQGPQPIPRTYHSSEIYGKYLIIYGGENITDQHDLNILNLETKKWEKIDNKTTQNTPPKRRFHSSAIIQDTLFIIGGCSGNYSCLRDIYQFDLKSYFEQRSQVDQDYPIDISSLWSQINYDQANQNFYNFNTFNNQIYNQEQPFSARWGHCSQSYDGKIYIFGGRNTQDLNDLYVLDPQKHTLLNINAKGKIPQPRRRTSVSIHGCSFVIFGGFDGNYYDDFFYINLFKDVQQSTLYWDLGNLVGEKILSDFYFKLGNNQGKLYAHKCLILHKLKNFSTLNQKSHLIWYVKNKDSLDLSKFNLKIEILRYFLEILYTGTLSIQINNQILLQLQQICRIFQLDQTFSFITQYLFQQLPEMIIQNYQENTNFQNFANQEFNKNIKFEIETVFEDTNLIYFENNNTNTNKNTITTNNTNLNTVNININNNNQKPKIIDYQILRNTHFIQNQNKTIMKLFNNNKFCFSNNIAYEKFYDVQIIVQGQKTIQANKIILCKRCSFFESLYLNSFQETTSKQIYIDNYSYEIVMIVLNYIYYDMLFIPNNSSTQFILQILDAAMYFNINRMIEICEKQISEMISLETIREVSIFALKYNSQYLIQQSCLFASQHQVEYTIQNLLNEYKQHEQTEPLAQKIIKEYNIINPLTKFHFIQQNLRKRSKSSLLDSKNLKNDSFLEEEFEDDYNDVLCQEDQQNTDEQIIQEKLPKNSL